MYFRPKFAFSPSCPAFGLVDQPSAVVLNERAEVGFLATEIFFASEGKADFADDR